MPDCPLEPLQAVQTAPSVGILAGVVLGLILAAVIAYELWATLTGHPTMTEWLRAKTARFSWWRVFAVSLVAVTVWHLLLGGPL